MQIEMFLKNQYWCFDKFLSKEICNKIIYMGEHKIASNNLKGISTPAATAGQHERAEYCVDRPLNELSLSDLRKEGLTKDDFYVRDSEICWLDDKWLYDLITPKIFEANKLAGWNWKLDCSELFQFTKYNDTGFYGWHMDGGSDHNAKYKRYLYGVTDYPCGLNGELPPNYAMSNDYIGKVRKVSVTINITDGEDYEGGDLQFDYGRHAEVETEKCIQARSQGSMIVFPSFLPHCVTPVTKGTRYSLVLWVLGEPWV